MKATCNSSPLITLAKADMLDVLPRVFDEIAVVQSVVDEIACGPADDLARRIVPGLKWLKRVELDPPITRMAGLQLGNGEAEVIESALRFPGYVAILDDRAARRSAGAVGVRCCGTLAVIGMAVKRGFLPSFAQAVASVRKAGLYVNDSIVEKVRATLGD